MPPGPKGAAPWRRLLPYLWRYRRAFGWGFLSTLAATAIQLAAPWVLQQAIDALASGLTRVMLAGYALLLLALAILSGVFRFVTRRTVIGASRHIEYDLRSDFYAHLQRLPPSWYHQRRTGDLMSRATNDLGAVRMMVGPAVMYASSTGLVFIVAIGLMAAIDPWLTGVALVPLPVVSLAVVLFGTAIHRRFERIQAQLSEMSAVVQEALSGVRVVRAYGQEESEVERFRAANQEYLDRNRRLIRLQAAFYPTLGFFLGLAAMAVLWMGSRAVIAGRMSVGELVAFNAYLVMLSWPVIAFGWVTNLIQRGLASWDRMLEIFDERPATADAPDARADVTAAAIQGQIEFRHLTVAYGDAVALRDVSAVIGAGETVAIVGATGSGKSTLLKTLSRLVDPPPGTVFIDGIDVRRLPLAVLRQVVAVVPQEPFLFSATLSANIAFAPEAAALDDAARDAVVTAAGAVARLDEDVSAFPAGYATEVGERGLTLSGGQKQRTAIARAIVADARILVLDDALSAVDTQTEEELLGRLAGVRRGRTTLIVSHRISTVQHADQILVVDAGRIVERGRHAALVAGGGLYARLHQRQLLEEELEEAAG